MRAVDTGIEIALTENFGSTAIQLKRLEADKAHKLLGVHNDPAGVGEEQIKYMSRHATEWHLQMLHSTLTPVQKRLSYMSELLPKLRYPLPGVTISEQEAERIVRPVLTSVKHAFGLPRT